MHIIKITPQSFKIILSNKDIEAYGEENIFENNTLSKQLLAKIIDETNRLYDNPFGEGSIDAEFFESKDGGGELFLSLCRNVNESSSHVFSTNDSDSLFMLCSRLVKMGHNVDSTLFHDGEQYKLVITAKNADNNLISVIKEYGNCERLRKLALWQLEEHAKVLCRENAVMTIANFT